MTDYSKMTDAEFEEYFDKLVNTLTIQDILAISGVTELVREELNNDVLDAWGMDQHRDDE